MKALIKFKKNSDYYKHGEHERIVVDLIEVHYSYTSHVGKQTAFESIDTGFTVFNKDIKEFSIVK